MKIIDPHLHFFALNEGDYHWLKADNPPFWPDKQELYHAFMPADLQLPEPLELSGFVHIEAGFDNQRPWREIAWLEKNISGRFRSIAFANLLGNDFKQVVRSLHQYPSFAGVRHILDEDASDILASATAQQHLNWLSEEELIFEAQLFALDIEGINALVRTLDKLPKLNVVLNHAGFVPNRLAEHSRWLNAMETLSEFPQVSVKCSGWEMTQRQWDKAWARDSIHQVIDVFGTESVMLASNFPVSQLGMSYAQLWQFYALELRFPKGLQEKYLNQNAARIYGFDK